MTFNSTERWYAIIGLGFLVWLIPFVFDLALLPLQVYSYLAGRFVYLALLALSAGVCGWLFLAQSNRRTRNEAWTLAGFWLLLALLLDFPARWLTAVPRPGLLGYALEFAIPLLAIPLTVLGCGWLLQYRRTRRKFEHVAPIPRYLRRP
jgi:hypothetical protein